MDEYKYRTVWKRIFAIIVDFVVFLPLAFVDKWIFDNYAQVTELFLISWIIIATFLPVCYSIFAHYWFGQTIGKWVMDIRVVDSSESLKLNFYQAVFRDGLPLGVYLSGLMYFGYLSILHNESGYLFAPFTDFVEGWLGWWWMLEVITMFTNYKSRALHDFMAQTVVVRVPAEKK